VASSLSRPSRERAAFLAVAAVEVAWLGLLIWLAWTAGA
jgi:hypothetical protein